MLYLARDQSTLRIEEGQQAKMAKKLITTGAAARRLECSPERVRQLEGEGAILATRTESGMRLFALDDVMKLARARALRKRTARRA
jgi:hypothetical protein